MPLYEAPEYGRADLSLRAGATWNPRFVYADGDGAPIDITGWSAELRFYRGRASGVILSVTGIAITGDEGALEPVLTPPQIATSLGVDRQGLYTFDLTDPDGVVIRFLEGAWMVTR